jgi:hypothetical protein
MFRCGDGVMTMLRRLPLTLALACSGVAAQSFAPPSLALAAERDDPRCAQYGPGFIHSEMSGFCIKVSGSVETSYRFGGGGSRPDSEASMSLDARGDTGLGPVRVLVEPKLRPGSLGE